MAVLRTFWEIQAIRHEMTYALRKNVLWPEKAIKDVMVDGDEGAVHFGAFNSGEIIGVVSLFSVGSAMQFRKLAVDPRFQGRGVGTALIKNCISFAQDKGVRAIWCDARLNAVGFYEKLGFTIGEHSFVKSGKEYKKAAIDFSPSAT